MDVTHNCSKIALPCEAKVLVGFWQCWPGSGWLCGHHARTPGSLEIANILPTLQTSYIPLQNYPRYPSKYSRYPSQYPMYPSKYPTYTPTHADETATVSGCHIQGHESFQHWSSGTAQEVGCTQLVSQSSPYQKDRVGAHAVHHDGPANPYTSKFILDPWITLEMWSWWHDGKVMSLWQWFAHPACSTDTGCLSHQ